MEDTKKQLEIYYNFKKSIKNGKNNLNSFKEYECLLTPKEDILNWKNYYEYDESLFSNDSKFKEWEYKIEIKTKYNKKPTFKIFKTFNEIKNNNNLIKGISVINKDFVSANGIKVVIQGEIKCYVGNKKILFEMNNIYGVFYICKVGKKEKKRYITLENVRPYNKSLINEILMTKDDILVQKQFTYEKSIFNYNVFYRIYLNNSNENIIKITSNANNLSNNQRKNDNLIIDNKKKIPDFIFETIILLYGLNEDIKNKVKEKIKDPEKYYLINYEWIEKFKECFNYSLIKNKLQNYKKYNTFSEFESNMKKLLEDIKKLNIVNKDIDNLNDIPIIPNVEIINHNIKHFTKFIIVNTKINDLIRKIKNHFKLKSRINNIENNFYFYPNIFYHETSFIEIGSFNSENMFISHYLIYFSINSNINLIISEIISLNSIDEFFKKFKINIDLPEKQDLIIASQIVGEIINLNYCNPIVETNKIIINKKINYKNIKNNRTPKKNNNIFKNINNYLDNKIKDTKNIKTNYITINKNNDIIINDKYTKIENNATIDDINKDDNNNINSININNDKGNNVNVNDNYDISSNYNIIKKNDNQIIIQKRKNHNNNKVMFLNLLSNKI